MSCCLDFSLILHGLPCRVLTRRGLLHFHLRKQCSCDVPTCLSATKSTFLLFTIMLITRIPAPKRFSLTSRPLFVARPKVAVIIVRGGGGSLIECHNSFLSPRFAKGQVFCFVVFFYRHELHPVKWMHICLPPTQI